MKPILFEVTLPFFILFLIIIILSFKVKKNYRRLIKGEESLLYNDPREFLSPSKGLIYSLLNKIGLTPILQGLALRLNVKFPLFIILIYIGIIIGISLYFLSGFSSSFTVEERTFIKLSENISEKIPIEKLQTIKKEISNKIFYEKELKNKLKELKVLDDSQIKLLLSNLPKTSNLPIFWLSLVFLILFFGNMVYSEVAQIINTNQSIYIKIFNFFLKVLNKLSLFWNNYLAKFFPDFINDIKLLRLLEYPISLFIFIGDKIHNTFFTKRLNQKTMIQDLKKIYLGGILGGILIGGIGSFILLKFLSLIYIPNELLLFPSYYIMLSISLMCGIYIVVRLSEEQKLDVNKVLDISLFTLTGILIGMRLFYVFQNWRQFDFLFPFNLDKFLKIFKIWEGGLVMYGGFIGALLFGVPIAIIKKVNVLKLMDAHAPALGLGIFFTRIGCFLNGCCHGKVCNLPWPLGISYPKDSILYSSQLGQKIITSDASHTVSVYATQLYESFWGLIIFIFLSIYWKKRKFEGEVFFICSIMYAVGRFFIEFFRGDPVRGVNIWGTGLSTSQIVSILLFCVSIFMLYKLKNRDKNSVILDNNNP